MDLPLLEDDLAEPGVLEAHMIHRRDVELPRVAVLCFFNELLEQLASEGLLTTSYVLPPTAASWRSCTPASARRSRPASSRRWPRSG
jgi:hypothetical protein